MKDGFKSNTFANIGADAAEFIMVQDEPFQIGGVPVVFSSLAV